MIGLIAIMSVAIVYAECHYDLLETIELNANVNVEECKQVNFAYAIFLDESCKKELVGTVDFGSVKIGRESGVISTLKTQD